MVMDISIFLVETAIDVLICLCIKFNLCIKVRLGSAFNFIQSTAESLSDVLLSYISIIGPLYDSSTDFSCELNEQPNEIRKKEKIKKYLRILWLKNITLP